VPRYSPTSPVGDVSDRQRLGPQLQRRGRKILGFASPIGMSIGEVFREARLASPSFPGSQETLAAAVQTSLRERSASRLTEADYVTPAGEPRILEITISPVYASLGGNPGRGLPDHG
jgi:hypothetical protein